jgi:hypothetical protein
VINTVEPTIIVDPLGEVGDLIALAVREAVNIANQRATVCGCRGCKVQAADAAQWAARMLQRDPDE